MTGCVLKWSDCDLLAIKDSFLNVIVLTLSYLEFIYFSTSLLEPLKVYQISLFFSCLFSDIFTSVVKMSDIRKQPGTI